MNFRERLKEAKQSNEVASELQAKVDSFVSRAQTELYNEINKKINENFKEKIIYTINFTTGYRTKNWDPHIAIQSVGDYVLTNLGSWVKNNGPRRKIYSYQIERTFYPRFQNKLCRLIREIEDEFGVRVEIVPSKVLTAEEIVHPRVKEDIYEIFGKETKILELGKIWYRGWVIEDVFSILLAKNQIEVLLSDDGHGGGMKPIQKNILALDDFFMKIEVDENNKNVKNKYYEKIKKKWKI